MLSEKVEAFYGYIYTHGEKDIMNEFLSLVEEGVSQLLTCESPEAIEQFALECHQLMMKKDYIAMADCLSKKLLL